MRALQDMATKELEGLKVQINAELVSLKVERTKKVGRLQAIQTEIDARKVFKAPAPTVSDHALLRYMERVMGFDVEGLRAKILTPSVIDAVNAGASNIVTNGAKMLIRDRTIITITEAT